MKKKLETKKAFKAVSKWDGELWSALYRHSCIQYFPGETVTPHENRGPLAAFQKKEKAIEWIRRIFTDIEDYTPYESIELWECEIEPSEETQLWTQLVSGRLVSAYPPNGTILCDSIRLTKLIGSWNGECWTSFDDPIKNE